ncbi:hypothetical protein [Bacillus velezensis]
MKVCEKLGIKGMGVCIGWRRILGEGRGKMNEEGVD